MIKSDEVIAPSLDEQVSQHMHLVHSAARRIARSLPRHVEVSDLVSAGVVGLIEALQRFESHRDISIKTFASARIEGAMLDSLRKLDWASRDLRRRGRAIETTIAKCTSVLGRSPDEQEIAQELQISLEEVQGTLADLHNVTLGGLQHVHSRSTDEMIDFIIDPQEPGALVRCLRAELTMIVAESLRALPERERLAAVLYYYEGLTDAEIGTVMRISRVRVAQLRTAAILRLRVMLSEHTVGRKR